MGSPITWKEKRCIANLNQSYLTDGKSEVEASRETSQRLGFGIQSVKNTIKEFLSTGNLRDNQKNFLRSNSFEKLAEEEITDLRQIIHNTMKECNVKRLNDENQDLQYPTLKSIHKVVLDSGRYPMWSYSTFREILLAMEIRMKTKSETDRSILIEDPYIENWRVSYLRKMEMHRISARPRFFMDETYIDVN